MLQIFSPEVTLIRDQGWVNGWCIRPIGGVDIGIDYAYIDIDIVYAYVYAHKGSICNKNKGCICGNILHKCSIIYKVAIIVFPCPFSV